MAFEGFKLSQIDVDEASLRVRHGGSGPPLLLHAPGVFAD
jgi:haloacetate dehalogenase